MTDKWCSTCTAIEHLPFTFIAMRPEVRVCATQMAPNSQGKTEVSNQRWRFIMEKYKGKKIKDLPIAARQVSAFIFQRVFEMRAGI